MKSEHPSNLKVLPAPNLNLLTLAAGKSALIFWRYRILSYSLCRCWQRKGKQLFPELLLYQHKAHQRHDAHKPNVFARGEVKISLSQFLSNSGTHTTVYSLGHPK
jgi:hypothetical protein